MKPAFILFSLLIAGLTWWLGRPQSRPGKAVDSVMRRLGRSLLAGVIVYIILMVVAMFWLLITTPAQAATPASVIWPRPPLRVALETPYGNLDVIHSEYVFESRLAYNGAIIDNPEIMGVLNIAYAFNMGKSYYVLVMADTGRKMCPYVYYWIRLDDDGYTSTPRFGSCNENIRISQNGSKFVIETPHPLKADTLDKYIYDGETVTEISSDFK